MDGQRRKRKVEEEDEEEEEEGSEEEKMEKFFALVRSTREVRERMTSGGLLRAKTEGGEKKPIEEKQTGWNPTFQPEDFMVDAQLKRCLVAVGSSSKKEEGKGKEKLEGDGLNLNLSL